MSAPDARAKALELWRNGFERHRRGDLRAAVDLYRRSIATCPTGEAHTFLGWAYAHSGDVERAIAECKRAIEIDPDFLRGRCLARPRAGLLRFIRQRKGTAGCQNTPYTTYDPVQPLMGPPPVLTCPTTARSEASYFSDAAACAASLLRGPDASCVV
jgi:tetratricopeptide (TPR) repeat protein